MERSASGSVGLPSECIAAEDEIFYARFVAPLEARMMRTVWRIVREQDLAQDTLQEALAVVWKRRQVIRSHPNPEALIIRMCIDAAYDCLRGMQRRRRIEAAEDAIPAGHRAEGGGMSQSQESAEHEVRRAVGRLPANQAVALLLRVVEDQPYLAIAAALGCSETTARIHVMRARHRLGRWLAHMAPSQRRTGGKT